VQNNYTPRQQDAAFAVWKALPQLSTVATVSPEFACFVLLVAKVKLQLQISPVLVGCLAGPEWLHKISAAAPH